MSSDTNIRYVMCVCFFFQAEDGIRDLVRSRGLGDVYKRQVHAVVHRMRLRHHQPGAVLGREHGGRAPEARVRAVSYTHLTLPTSDLV